MKKAIFLLLVGLFSLTSMAALDSSPPVQEKKEVVFVLKCQSVDCVALQTEAFEAQKPVVTQNAILIVDAKVVKRFGYVYQSIDYENYDRSLFYKKGTSISYKAKKEPGLLPSKHRIRYLS